MLLISVSADGLHPVPVGPVPGGSIAGWIWLMVLLAVIVVAGVVLSSRR